MSDGGVYNGVEIVTGGRYRGRLKADMRRCYGPSVYLAGYGELIPNEQSYGETDLALPRLANWQRGTSSRSSRLRLLQKSSTAAAS